MKILKIAFLTICLASCSVFGQINVSSGTIKRFENFSSKYVAARNIDVWLPDGYSKKKKYAVIYMHDGQMLFDASTTWNKQEWRVDETVGKLIKEQRIRDCIVVGIWNTGETRYPEYFPQKALVEMPREAREFVLKRLNDNPLADRYLRFLVRELKPFIDKTFSTQKDKRHTVIMGSSMGGLISIYALCEFPNVFGGAAGISTHWPLVGTEINGQNEAIAAGLRTYMKKRLPKANSRNIYFDHGDQTLDAFYPPFQKRVDEIMTSRGYTARAWMTRSFPGENHSETSWAKRLNIPLEFLLGR